MVINNGIVARATVHRAARYIVSSEFQKQELRALGYAERRVDVIPNLIDTTKLRRWDKAEARQALGLPDGPLVAFVGHFHDVKGHDVLIDAFPAVRREVPDARLALAWSGIGSQYEVRAQIARVGIADRVIELGKLDVGQLFSAADVVALPYRFSIGQAAYPGTVLEAMIVGVPLVTTALPLLEELTDRGDTAALATPGDSASLAAAITALLRDTAAGDRLVAAQARAMADRFNQDKLLDRYETLYRQVLEQS
jgi:glycosyltransferase involved in cell wall biosynthesis